MLFWYVAIVLSSVVRAVVTACSVAVILPELKVDFEIMNKVAYLLNWGANIGVTSASIIGGYCGGPAGTALVTVANILTGLLVHQGNYHHRDN